MKEYKNNPFKNLHPGNDVPAGIKKDVMKEITLITLFGDITDLFIGKMGKTAMELLKRDKNNNH